MISFEVIVGDVLLNARRSIPCPIGIIFDRHSSLDRTHVAFGERIQIGRTRRQPDHLNALPRKHLPKFNTVFCVSIDDQVRLSTSARRTYPVDYAPSASSTPHRAGR